MSNLPPTLSYAPAQPEPKGFFPAFRHRNFRLWFWGGTISVIGTWMTGMSLSWLMWTYTHKAAYLGLLGVAFQAPMALVALRREYWLNRVQRRWMIMVTQTFLMFSSVALAVLSFAGLLNEHVILLLAVIRGVIQGFDMVGRQSFVLEMVDRPTLPSAVALNSATFNTGRAVGPAVAGYLLYRVGPSWCFTIDAITYLAVLMVLPMMRLTNSRPRRRGAHPVHDLRLGITLALTRPRIYMNLALLAVMSTFVLSYGTLLPAFAEQVYKGGPSTFGWLSAATGIGALVGALCVSAFCRQQRQGLWMFAGALLAGAGLTSLAAAPNMAMGMLCLMLVGFSALSFGSPSNAASQLAASDRYRGRVMSLHSMVFISTMPIGAMFYGFLADHIGVRPAVLMGAIIAVVAALTLGLRMMRMDPRNGARG